MRRVYPQFVSTSLLLAPIGKADNRCSLLVSPKLLAAGAEDKDNSPRAILLLKIKGAKPSTLFHTGVIGIGLCLQNFAEPIQGLLPAGIMPSIDPATVSGGIKVLGVFITMLGVLFGLKQLPNLPGQS